MSSPAPSPQPSSSTPPGPSPSPGSSGNPGPSASASPSPLPSAPIALNLYRPRGFRYQDPNWHACTATAAQDMLNFIALVGSGGDGFRWRLTVSSIVRDTLLRFERHHDTIVAKARGSDPHGWRNALNYYGWGAGTVLAGSMVYEDQAFTSYASAMRSAVRQMVLTGKPVGMLGWAGSHALVITGYYGLRGDPLRRNADGSWSDAFSVAGFYVTDPLRADRVVNRPVGYKALATTTNYRLRFRPFAAYDSPYDDPYTPGYRASRLEWYRRYVLLVPTR